MALTYEGSISEYEHPVAISGRSGLICSSVNSRKLKAVQPSKHREDEHY